MRCFVSVALIIILANAITSNTFAQRPKAGTLEFAMLGGLSKFNFKGYFGSDYVETYISLPNGSGSYPASSALRMTIWTKSQLVYNFGFSFINASNGGDLTIGNIETGIGAAFGKSDDVTFPFAGASLGLLTLANGSTKTGVYIGFQGGMRHFFRKYASVRMQLGYRSFIGDELRIKSALEIAGGLSFFI